MLSTFQLIALIICSVLMWGLRDHRFSLPRQTWPPTGLISHKATCHMAQESALRVTMIQLIHPPTAATSRSIEAQDETETTVFAEGQWKMVLALRDCLSKCLWAALPVRYFQKENLVITIKRPYYIADFLEKSVFYWAGPQTHTHPASHNTLK